MATGNKICETNRCAACNCKCTGTGGHECTSCNVCSQADDHTRK